MFFLTFQLSKHLQGRVNRVIQSAMLAVMLLTAFTADARAATKTLTVSWEAPNPAENGMTRAVGDGDNWDFNLQMVGVIMVAGPNWSYPTKGAADPAWGLFNENGTTVSWSGALSAREFTVSVSGRIRRVGGGGGGVGGGGVEEKDFNATWSGEVVGKRIWTVETPIGGAIISPGSESKVGPGGKITFTITDATDVDHWRYENNGDGIVGQKEGYEADTI